MGIRRSLRDAPPLKCSRDRDKVIYHNRKAARSAAARTRRRTQDKSVNEYKCRFASHFHIGHDHFNKNKKPNFNNSTLANRKVAEVSCLPARPAVPRPQRERAKPDSLVGTTIRVLSRQAATEEGDKEVGGITNAHSEFRVSKDIRGD